MSLLLLTEYPSSFVFDGEADTSLLIMTGQSCFMEDILTYIPELTHCTVPSRLPNLGTAPCTCRP